MTRSRTRPLFTLSPIGTGITGFGRAVKLGAGLVPTAALAAARWRQRSINPNDTLILAPQARPHRVAFIDVIRCRHTSAAITKREARGCDRRRAALLKRVPHAIARSPAPRAEPSCKREGQSPPFCFSLLFFLRSRSPITACRRGCRGLSRREASVPIPKFASLCGTLVCELRNRRTLATY